MRDARPGGGPTPSLAGKAAAASKTTRTPHPQPVPPAFVSPVGPPPRPPSQQQRQRAAVVNRAVSRGMHGQAPTTLADVQRYGFQNTARFDTSVRGYVGAQKRQDKLDHLIDVAASGAQPNQFMPQLKAMKLTPDEKSYAAHETARRGNINIAKASGFDPFSAAGAMIEKAP